MKGAAYIAVLSLLVAWVGYGWYQDDQACQHRGGVYVRGFFYWQCVQAK